MAGLAQHQRAEVGRVLACAGADEPHALGLVQALGGVAELGLEGLREQVGLGGDRLGQGGHGPTPCDFPVT